jgi:hypothetical protein
MKYLLVLAVIAIAYMLWRGARTREIERERRDTPALPQDMVRCPVCAVHLPRADALPGPDGRLYCCAEHRPRSGS